MIENNQTEELQEFDVNYDLEQMFTDSYLDMDLIGDDAISSQRIKTQSTKLIRYPRFPAEQIGYRHAVDLARKMPDLATGEAQYVLVAGSFIFGDFLEALIVEKNWLVDEMIIATLSMGQNNIDSLCNLVAGGYVDKVNLIISDYWYANEYRSKKGGVAYLKDKLGENLTFAAAGLHTKVTLIKTSCDKHLVMHGSANLRSSQNIEQVCLENNPELYEFNRGWMSRILDNYATNGDSLRGEKLWQHLTEQKQSND